MASLSAVIITFNEENNIARCINSLKGIADEIVVVDSLSTDNTKNICLEHNVIFIEQKFLGYVEQKNFALKHASNDYVLSLDADEVLSNELRYSILAVKNDLKKDSYSFNRLTNYAGFWVKHSGWYPDRKTRLFNKSKGRWVGADNIHEKFVLIKKDNSTHQTLKGDLYHYSYPSISAHVTQTNNFTTIAAQAAYKRGIRSNIFKIYSRTILCFFRDYFFRLGILDGKYGFIICFINSFSVMLKYSKIKELQEDKPI